MIEILRNPKHRFALFPILVVVGIVLSLRFWPPQEYDVTPLVRPPVAEAGDAVPATIISVAQGQPVGDEAYFKGFRLNSGWHLSPTGDYGRYTLVAKVTNIMDTPDVARVLVRVRVADRYTELLMCSKELAGGESGMLSCSATANAQYTSRWSRITLESF